MRSTSFDSERSSSRVLYARRRRRRTAINYQLRVVALAVAGVLFAFVAISVVKKTIHPYILGHEEGARIARLQAHLAHQNALNDALRRQIAYLESDEGKEREARHKGFHYPGEVVYLLDTPREAPSAAGDTRATATPAPVNPVANP